MARPRLRPAPPRGSEPDLPRHLVAGRLARRAELTEASIRLEATADGAHARLSESRLVAASVDRLDLTGAVLADVVIDDPAAAEIVARDGSWRSVRLSGGRIGTLDLSRGRWDGVLLRGVRVDYLSVPASTLRDVTFSGCRIGTLDAPGAVLERVRFEDTAVDEFDTREMRSTDLDLRGLDVLAFTDVRALREATMSERQVEAHARALATALGIDVQEERHPVAARSGSSS
ncbi:hypothetical protein [Microbacterium oleivorans]|uniref:Pentapeptide repeat-containing protein n=1 Tax=Microbacterium oleivorans TaxID=273677 RepID=A0A7D5ETU8_9MICO|nr:hypothetical protein [Microbacterium oleivorans]QLD10431.1 hypothetical protein HW566_00680 [Microbacterium oleivorans]